jgi:hypothetical protein
MQVEDGGLWLTEQERKDFIGGLDLLADCHARLEGLRAHAFNLRWAERVKLEPRIKASENSAAYLYQAKMKNAERVGGMCR